MKRLSTLLPNDKLKYLHSYSVKSLIFNLRYFVLKLN